MAIIIPSKNIYDKQNPKVRDNVIERIEVGAVEVVPNSFYEDVAYNQKIKINNVEALGAEDNQISVQYEGAKTGGYGNEIHRLSVSYAGYLQKKVSNIEVYVPFINDNKYIKNIRKEEPVGCTLYGDVTTGALYGAWKFVIGNPETGLGTTPAIENKRQNLERLGESTTKNALISFKEKLVVEEKEQEYYNVSSKVELDLNEFGNLNTPPIEKENQQQYYKISLTIPVALLEETATGSFIGETGVVPEGDRAKIAMDGEFTLYEAKTAEITVYGDTIGIDLQNKTVYINGETAKKVHSVDGNELMQTSNYSNIEQPFDISQLEIKYTSVLFAHYAKINFKDKLPRDFTIDIKVKNKTTGAIVDTYINAGVLVSEAISINKNDEVEIISATQRGVYSIEWSYLNTQNLYKNGKETATIRCSISDYFSEKYDRSEHIDIADKRFKVVQEPPNDRYDAPPSYGIFETKYRIINIVSFDGKSISGDEQIVVEQISDTKLKIYFNQAGANIDYVDLRLEVQDAILINNSSGRMSFKLYDQVIPMVYGADGKDYPMSKYNDGSPKIFQVLGTKVYYDGAVWQELSLQEI